MLATLFAAGLFDGTTLAGTGPLIAAPEAIVIVPRVASTVAVGSGIPIGAPVWQLPLDPNDQVPFAWDFTPLLDSGAKIASVVALTMSATGAAVGVQIASAAPCAPVITTDGQHVQLWLQVDPALVAAGAFDGAGVQVGIAAKVRTDEAPPRTFERTGVVIVRQL